MNIFHRKHNLKHETTTESPLCLNQFYAPVCGIIKNLSEAPEPSYSQKIIGDGIFVLPTDGNIYAPADCTVAFIFPSQHAVGLRTETGIELLLHIGFTTGKLHANAISFAVQEDQDVKCGELLLTFDLAQLKQRSASPAVSLVVTNLSDTQKIVLGKTGNVTLEDIIFEIR